MDQLSKLFGSVFGLAAFAVAVVGGIAAGNAAPRVLMTALVSMMVCYFVGTLLGMIAERTVAEHASGYAEARSIPSIPKAEVAQRAGVEGVDKVREIGRAG